MTGAYPPAPQHLRAACVHPDGRLPGKVRAATLQIYLDDGLVYRNDGDGYACLRTLRRGRASDRTSSPARGAARS